MFDSIKTLLNSSLAVAALMVTTYFLPIDSLVASILIYAPITIIISQELHDNGLNFFTVSSILSVIHGLTHNNYRFLSIDKGFDRREIDGVAFDQVLHLAQAILFLVICRNRKTNNYFINLFSCSLVVGNSVALFFANKCLNTEAKCYDLFVKFSVFQTVASGIHFAIGAEGPIKEQDRNFFFYFMQGFSALIIRASFKHSNDIIKLFSRTRFFESYFIVPHVVGYFNGPAKRANSN